MANTTVGNAQNLTDSSAQALQTLINSLTPAEASGEKLTIGQVKKLSDKLSQIVRDGPDGPTEMRNDKGELVNEEGLPIIDITEPLQDTEITSVSEPLLIANPELVSLTSLPEAEAERRRRERDRILDLLEAEERREQELIEKTEREERQESLEKRKNAPEFELEKLKAAKEMQKKMGKALLHNMAQAREREEKEKIRVLTLDQESKEKKILKAKKSVSFADLPPQIDGDRTRDKSGTSPKGTQLDWGDVSPARLRATNRHMLLTKVQIDSHPMKMDVIECMPLGAPVAEEPIVEQGDSDDESVPDSPVPADSEDGDTIHDGDESQQVEAHSSDSDGDEEPEDEPIVADEYDLDMARHQREITLEYYKKRGTIGEGVSKAIRSHAHEEVEDEWDQEEVPLEATLSSPHPKPLMSKFKASRIASHYNISAPSTSLGTSVLPASSSRTLQRAIRTGKLENDQLVVSVQSDIEDEDEDLKDVLELLKKGQVRNVGPEHNLPSPSQSTSFNRPPTSLEERVPAVTKLKTSKFKLTRPQGSPRLSSPTISESQPVTPVSHARRSFPNLPSSPVGVVECHPPSSNSILPQEPQAASQLPSLLSPEMPTIIESPSFRRPPHTTLKPPAASSTFPSTVDSPSFSTIVVPPFQPRGPTRPDRPPVVMSSTVREVPRHATGQGGKGLLERREPNSSGEKKVSRFLAERM